MQACSAPLNVVVPGSPAAGAAACAPPLSLVISPFALHNSQRSLPTFSRRAASSAVSERVALMALEGVADARDAPDRSRADEAPGLRGGGVCSGVPGGPSAKALVLSRRPKSQLPVGVCASRAAYMHTHAGWVRARHDGEISIKTYSHPRPHLD